MRFLANEFLTIKLTYIIYVQLYCDCIHQSLSVVGRKKLKHCLRFAYSIAITGENFIFPSSNLSKIRSLGFAFIKSFVFHLRSSCCTLPPIIKNQFELPENFPTSVLSCKREWSLTISYTSRIYCCQIIAN